MTTRRWNEEMLDRLAERMAEVTEVSLRAVNLAEDNARIMEALANRAAEAREERERIFQFIAEKQEIMARQQEAIAQQQTEMKRMMDMWFDDRRRNEDEGEDNYPS